MRNYISLALVTTPSGLGSHCKHVGAPTRLRIGNRLRPECSAVARRWVRARKGRGVQRHHIPVRMQKRKTDFFPMCGEKVVWARWVYCAIVEEVPADATDRPAL